MDRPGFSRGFLITVLFIAGAARDGWGEAAVPLAPGVNAGNFAITPDGSHVVFESYQETGNVLYGARTDGGGAVTLSLGSGSAFLFNSKFTPDSSKIVFNSNEFPGGEWHVATYSNRVDGIGGPVLLNMSKVYDDDSSQYNLAISPDSGRVAIRADQGDYDFDLLSRPVNGSLAAIPLNENGHGGGFGEGVQYNWTAAGNRMVFAAPPAGGGANNLYSRLFDGSLPAVQLSPEGRTFVDYVVSGDGSRVALTATGTGGRGLYSRAVDGGPLTILAGEDDHPQAFIGLWIDPHGQHVVFNTDLHLSTVPADGSAEPKSLSPYPAGQDVQVAISPTGGKVALLSRPGGSGPLELFVSDIDGSSAPKKLNLPLPVGGSIDYLAFAPDGQHLIYFGDQVTDGVEEMFSVPVDGSALPVKLGPAGAFAVSHDGKTVFTVSGGGPFMWQAINATPIDGGEPVQIANNPFATGGIYRWELTPDDSMLIFTADNAGGTSEIFAVAIPEPGGMAMVMLGAIVLTRRLARRWI